MTQTKNIAVVILNYNGSHFLKKYLPNIIINSTQASIYVADNGSTDDSINYLNTINGIQIIKINKNLGYTGGYNFALKQLNETYFVLLNSDIEVTENWLIEPINLLINNNEIAVCQPKLLDLNNKSKFEYAGAAGGFIDKYGYPFCKGRLFETLEEDNGQYNNAEEIFWASGACLFIKSEIFKKIGGFDEKYFAHMEEIDLCWRIKNMGYKIFYEPKSIVYHLGGGTLNKANPKKTFLNFRNNLSTVLKNHQSHFVCLIIFYRLCLDGIAAFKFLTEGYPKLVWQVLKAHFNFYAWLPVLLKQRKYLKQQTKTIKIKNTAAMYNGNIVWQYFIKKKKTYKSLFN
jgi:GT2 family glycosyltransferase